MRRSTSGIVVARRRVLTSVERAAALLVLCILYAWGHGTVTIMFCVCSLLEMTSACLVGSLRIFLCHVYTPLGHFCF